MKRATTAVSALVFVPGTAAALADSHEQEPRRCVPVETWTCNYEGGKGAADLDAVIDAWNEWTDDDDQDDYFARTVTPRYFGENTFDVGWLVSWTDGAAMGRATDLWKAAGNEIMAQFDEVLDCDPHSNFASTELKSPGEGPIPDNLVLTFSDCTGPDEPGAWDQLMSGLGSWSAYISEHGYHQGDWMMIPVFGGSGAEFDFKWVEGFGNHTELGEDYQLFAERADWEKQGELLGGLMDCDDARVYDATVRRRSAAEQ